MTIDASPAPPLICQMCHKKFLCSARASGHYPSWKPDCQTIKECTCAYCNQANQGSNSCKNVPFETNPSRRDCSGNLD